MVDKDPAATPKRRTRRKAPREEPAPPRRVLLTAADGLVGRAILPRLLTAGSEVVAVGSTLPTSPPVNGTIQIAAELRGMGWQPWAAGCTAAVHLAPAIGETGAAVESRVPATATVVDWCRSNGVGRIVLVSCLGARRDAPTTLQREAWTAEEAVRGSELVWTILRPAVVFGPGDCLATRLATVFRRHAILPVPGDGNYRLQPIAAEDVAVAAVGAIDNAACHGQCYDLGGPEVITFNELARRTARNVRPGLRLLHVPPRFSNIVTALLERMRPSPLTRQELALFQAGASCDSAPATAAFGPAAVAYRGATWLAQRVTPGAGSETQDGRS